MTADATAFIGPGKPSSGDIFVVDDNPHNIGALTGLLREGGYQVRAANSGQRALAAIGQRPPELILLDINMPDLDGFAVCKQLKAQRALAGIPVVFLSALDDVSDKVTAFEAGGVDYITKPFQALEVLARVNTQLRLARLQRALEEKNRELEQRYAELADERRNSDRMFNALAEVLPGTELAGYRLIEKIGEGGFGAVFRSTRIADGQEVAIKVLRPPPGLDDTNFRARFDLEVEAMRRFQHPHAVRVIDAGMTRGTIAYLVMELLHGESLADRLARTGRLDVRKCLEVFVPVCDLLAEAHAQGVIHRDIKPANLFLHLEQGRERTKVVDFGVARIEQPSELTTAGRMLGTPMYMGPERLLGQPHDGRVDVYSVGVSMYKALADTMPFELPEDAAGIVMVCITDPARPLRGLVADVPPALEELIMRTLAKLPAQRPTMRELADALTSMVSTTASG